MSEHKEQNDSPWLVESVPIEEPEVTSRALAKKLNQISEDGYHIFSVLRLSEHIIIICFSAEKLSKKMQSSKEAEFTDQLQKLAEMMRSSK